ncbi:MAG: endonuclease III [Oscillospiraceae bacterium]|nr:endonuclease III [Oscillospiraceae bacterium]
MERNDVLELIRLLKLEYPDALCSLEYKKDYELLFATRLAAQCTDERVNMVAPGLFAAYPTLESLAEARLEDVEELIHSCGFFRAKARDIIAASKMLVSDFGGRVPGNMDDLLKLPGVGRKTANLILGDIFKTPGSVVVDTHCIRLANRLGLVSVKEPAKIEISLREQLPGDETNDFCHRLVLHGRAICTARSPRCAECCLKALCAEGKTHAPALDVQ